MTTEALHNTAWHLGMAGETGILRPHAQTSLYRFTHEWKKANPDQPGPLVFMCHRRLGKSWLLALMCIERCLSAPNQEVKYGAPTLIMCRDIIRPLVESILESCPWQLRPERRGLEYYFKNPAWGKPSARSVLKLIGCNVDQGNRLRGQAADLVVLDEVRDIKNLDYVVRDVVGPQFVGRSNPLLVLISTPPRSMDHDLTKPQGFLEESEKEGRYKCVPITLNGDWTERDDKLMERMLGGKNTNAWKREALCELVSDETALIVPEFIQEQADGRKIEQDIVVGMYPRPKRYSPMVAMDTGWNDRTAVCFAYVDFPAQLLVFERTIVFRYKTTGEVADQIRKVEEELWKDNPGGTRRFADALPQQIADLRSDHKLSFQPVQKQSKHDQDSTIATFRDGILNKQVRILRESNQSLIYQLRNGVWNDARTDFERTEGLGHWDAGIAAAYAYRMAPWRRNPALEKQYDKQNTFNYGEPLRRRESKMDALLVALGRKLLK